jgi:hypothetical protein
MIKSDQTIFSLEKDEKLILYPSTNSSFLFGIKMSGLLASRNSLRVFAKGRVGMAVYFQIMWWNCSRCIEKAVCGNFGEPPM